MKTVCLAKNSSQKLLHDYSDVFRDKLGTITLFKAPLVVSSSTVPRFHHPRPVAYALQPQINQQLDRIEKAGVLQHVMHSDWAAPIVMVPKRDGQVRVCGDYKTTVKSMLDLDQYPLPRPEDLFASLAGGKSFSTLDLSHVYNQLVLNNNSGKYLTINTHRGLYQYHCLPFGVASAPSIFQKAMETILQGMEGIICYLDDILVSGKTKEEHLTNLGKVLQRLQEHGIRAKRAKCTFLKTSVQYLGHIIDSHGLHATEEKLDAIVHALAPKNVHKLRSFLRLPNYYSHFIPNLLSLLHPLNHLLRHNVTWRWTKACSKAFECAKEEIVSLNVLVQYDSTGLIRLAADASVYGLGAVITHVMDDGS